LPVPERAAAGPRRRQRAGHAPDDVPHTQRPLHIPNPQSAQRRQRADPLDPAAPVIATAPMIEERAMAASYPRPVGPVRVAAHSWRQPSSGSARRAVVVNDQGASTSPRGGHVTRRRRLSPALRSSTWTSFGAYHPSQVHIGFQPRCRQMQDRARPRRRGWALPHSRAPGLRDAPMAP